MYQPNGGKGVAVADVPAPLPSKGSDAIYCYENLPQEHWKKYVYAARFVSLVKAKTPKVILYSDRAKCLLMENGPDADFEALFYCGWKMSRTSNAKLLQITEPAGGPVTNVPLTNSDQSPDLDRESLRDMWRHLTECLAHCERIESAVHQLTGLAGTSGSPLPFFPLTVGRKPTANAAPTPKLSSSNKENRMVEPVLSGLKSFDGSVRSATNSSSRGSSLRQKIPSNVGTRMVEVVGIGRAIQKPSGNKTFSQSIFLLTVGSNDLTHPQASWKCISPMAPG